MPDNRSSDLITRGTFDAHESDPEAHGEMRHRYGSTALEERVRALETWRTFTAGGLAVLAIQVTGGLLVVLAHLAHLF